MIVKSGHGFKGESGYSGDASRTAESSDDSLLDNVRRGVGYIYDDFIPSLCTLATECTLFHGQDVTTEMED